MTATLCLNLFCTQAFAAADIPIKQRLIPPVAGAHQGGIVVHLDPNTLERFKKARRAGVEVIETDLRVSKDGVAMIYHDESLNRWTWCKGKLRSKTAHQIQKCRYKLTRHKIPTFEDVLKWAHGRVVINAELKDSDVIGPTVAMIQKYKAHDWVYLQAKSDPDRYTKVRELDSRVALCFAPSNAQELNWALAQDDDYLVVIEIHDNLRKKKYIQMIHDAGKLVSEDSWHLVFDQLEVLGAGCRATYKHGIDIAISNRTTDCVRQKLEYQRKHQTLE